MIPKVSTPATWQLLRLLKKASIDFALVDGHLSQRLCLALLEKIKPGGCVIIDNANLHLPCHSHSPNSRTPQMVFRR